MSTPSPSVTDPAVPPRVDSTADRNCAPGLEAAIRAHGERLFALMDQHPPPALFSKKGAYARLMDWAMKDPSFKTQLFRFVDVLPSLTSSNEIVRHLQEYLGDRAVEINPTLRVGLGAASLAPALVATPVKAQIVDLAGQFVAGADATDLIRRIRHNTQLGYATTVDLLGETVLSEAEAEAFQRRNLEVLDTVAAFFAREPEPGFGDLGPQGPLPRLNLSVKVSALAPAVAAADPARAIASLSLRLRPILQRARQVGALVNLDMESRPFKDLTLALFRSILEEPDFREQPAMGIAVQAYLRDSEPDLRDLLAWARRQHRPITIRLVKGAYWDSETILARQRNWPSPVWNRKPETDAHFEKLTTLLLENAAITTPAFATHNVRSCAHALAQAERLGVDPRAFEFQALYGMADELKAALRQSGYRVREYCAVGDLLPGMAYLVRRLLENTSNEGFLRQKHTGERPRAVLLENPAASIDAAPPGTPPPPRADAFLNASNTDFTLSANRDRQRAALAAATASLGRRCPLLIGGHRIADREWVASINPAHPSQIVGYWARGTPADADAALAAAVAAFPSWRATPVETRAAILDRAADLFEARRFAINALLILEAAKPWIEADGETSEAIDFCRFYAREMRRLDRPVVTQPVPGEDCVQVWTPRGVGVAIAPWNFPLAILTGLTVAPLVAGNCVVIKPSRQTALIAALLVDGLVEAGTPPGVLAYLPCAGAEAGARLVADPRVAFIAFTGSRAVGCGIWESAGATRPGQANLKKVVCEMGGKNAAIVDNDADLDEAIPAVLASAFGYAGQKCSALARLIVLDGIYDRFLERFLAACATVPIGDPADPGTVVNPVIDAAALESIRGHLAQGSREAKLAWQAPLPAALAASGGYYVPPSVFVDCRPEHALVREEIFGPVVAVLRARDLDHAFALANASDYALTGAFFGRSPSALARARRDFLVGNLYLNRGCTGALVERHPFGGFKMSGGGTKAGGSGYLEQFLFPRVIAENTLRRGFTPPEAA